MNRIVASARVSVPAVLFSFATVGVFGSQFESVSGSGHFNYYLYKFTSDKGSSVYFVDGDRSVFTCPAQHGPVAIAFTLGIVGWILALAGVFVALANGTPTAHRFIKMYGHCVNYASFFALAFCLAITYIMYYNSLPCEGLSLSSHADIDYGFEFLLISVLISVGWCIFDLAARRASSRRTGPNQSV